MQKGFVTEGVLERTSPQSAAALLLQLDRAGALVRELRLGVQPWARVLPQRAPDMPPPAALPKGSLRLTATVVVHAGTRGLTLEVPGAWARVELLQPALLPLLDGLARGCSPARARQLVQGGQDLVQALLLMLLWCGLLADARRADWAAHDLLLHSRTRRGLGLVTVGKLSATPTAPVSLPTGPRKALEPGAAGDLKTALGAALARRESLREHGPVAIPLQALGRFLWHTLAAQVHEGRVRRPYPSGGGCYALQPFLVIEHCAGLDAGLYAYDALSHELILVRPHSIAQRVLMRDAARSAHSQTAAQVLLVLCADYARMRSAYGDLGYSLLLKEVGAVMQTAQLVAAALGLACCPLGTGDALRFAEAAGAEPWTLPAVGELLLGTST